MICFKSANVLLLAVITILLLGIRCFAESVEFDRNFKIGTTVTLVVNDKDINDDYLTFHFNQMPGSPIYLQTTGSVTIAPASADDNRGDVGVWNTATCTTCFVQWGVVVHYNINGLTTLPINPKMSCARNDPWTYKAKLYWKGYENGINYDEDTDLGGYI